MATTYTLRYTNKAGDLIRMLMIQCKDDQDALRAAATTMPSPYATLAICKGHKLVWRGAKQKVTGWVSPPPRQRPSYTAHAS